MKSEVYSWRVSTELKTALEGEARRRKVPLSAVLDLATRDWLGKNGSDAGSDEQQLRLHKAAAKYFGAMESGIANRAENARRSVRARLRRRHAS